MDITKYEPMIEVLTKDGEVYYTLASNREQIEKDWADRDIPFIRIDGVTIATRIIDKIKPMKAGFNYLALPIEQREIMKAEIIKFKSNLKRDPKESELVNMYNRLFPKT